MHGATSLTPATRPLAAPPSARVRAALLALGLVAGSAPSRALAVDAQPEAAPAAADERARVLFQQGVSAARHHDYGDALAAFEASLSLRHSPNTSYNAAAALFELRRYREAHTRLADALATPELAAEVAASARTLERKLRPHVALLRVLTSGVQGEVTLRVDGEPAELAAWEAGRALEPGAHVVTLTDAAGRTSERPVEAVEGSTTVLDVHILPSVAPPPQAATPALPVAAHAATPVDAPPRSRASKVWTGVALGVVAAAAVGVGVALARREQGGSPDVPSLEPGVLTW